MRPVPETQDSMKAPIERAESARPANRRFPAPDLPVPLQQKPESDASIRELLRLALVRPAKSDGTTPLLRHLSHAVQIVTFLSNGLPLEARRRDRLRLAAALHDIGKAVTKVRGQRWPHARAGAELVPAILADPLFQELAADAGLPTDLTDVEVQEVADLVAAHHGLTPELLLRVPAAPLMLVADALTSALEEGYIGRLDRILSTSGYHSGALAQLERIGWAPWARLRVHRLRLPSERIGDLVLAERVIELVIQRATELGLATVLRDTAELWLGGEPEAFAALGELDIATDDILDRAGLRAIYERPGFPRAPTFSVTSLRYFHASDECACLILRDLFVRRSAGVRDVLERRALTFEALTAGHSAADLANPDALAQILYAGFRANLIGLSADVADVLPEHVSAVLGISASTWDRGHRDAALALALAAAPDAKSDLEQIGKFITAANGQPASIVGAVIARARTLNELANRLERYTLRDVGFLNTQTPRGANLSDPHNRLATCAVCGRREAKVQASALIAGAPEADSPWSSAGKRRHPKICTWCHHAGVADLPLASLRAAGTRRIREDNYLFVESVISRDRLISTLEGLGVLRGAAVDLARAEGTEPDTFDAVDEELFDALFGAERPEPTSVIGMAGLSGAPTTGAMHGIVLPSKTPFASRAVFALSSAAILGADVTTRMQKSVAETVLRATMARIGPKIGPATFRLRAPARQGRLNVGDAEVEGDSARQDAARIEIAEFQRVLVERAAGRYPEGLDTGFVLDLVGDVRTTVSRLIRTLLRMTPPPSRMNETVHRLIELSMQAGGMRDERDVDIALLLRAVGQLGLMPQANTLVVRPSRRGGWRGRYDLLGPLTGLWNLTGTRDLDAWIRSLAERSKAPREVVNSAIQDIRRVAETGARRERGDVAAWMRRISGRLLIVRIEEAWCVGTVAPMKARPAGSWINAGQPSTLVPAGDAATKRW